MGTRSGALLGIGVVVVAVVVGLALKRTRHDDTVVVPGVRSGNVLFAFERLRESGLRVAIPSTIRFLPTSSPRVTGQTPPGGTRVEPDSVVTLRLSSGGIGSPAGPDDLPVYRVPGFSGKPLADAVAWTKGKVLYWASDMPPLAPSSAQHLFDAYVVKSQHPQAGSNLKLWVRTRDGEGVRLTPLTLQVAPR